LLDQGYGSAVPPGSTACAATTNVFHTADLQCISTACSTTTAAADLPLEGRVGGEQPLIDLLPSLSGGTRRAGTRRTEVATRATGGTRHIPRIPGTWISRCAAHGTGFTVRSRRCGGAFPPDSRRRKSGATAATTDTMEPTVFTVAIVNPGRPAYSWFEIQPVAGADGPADLPTHGTATSTAATTERPVASSPATADDQDINAGDPCGHRPGKVTTAPSKELAEAVTADLADSCESRRTGGIGVGRRVRNSGQHQRRRCNTYS
jgi:hypothetical protein